MSNKKRKQKQKEYLDSLPSATGEELGIDVGLDFEEAEEQTKKALDTAYQLHKNQTRKGSSIPYIVHIYDVFKYLSSEPNIAEEVILAGILHDTLEDTEYTVKELGEEFGEGVLQLVKFATEPDNKIEISIDEKRRSWKNRKQHTIDICQNGSKEELLVVLADKLANLNSINEDLRVMGNEVWSKFNSSKDEIAWYYKSLGDCFRGRLSGSRMLKLYDGLIAEVFD
jgi:(p)ppGpp synthase/HD superfamily hydrolase